MKKWVVFPILFAFAVVLSACSNSGSGSSSTNRLTGTAAAGAAVSGTITVAGANGNTVGPLAISSDGSFSVDVSTLTPPFMVEVEGTANGQTVHFFVAATETGRVNVTPMTHAATRMAMGNDVTSVTQTIPANIDVEGVAQKIASALQPILQQMGINASLDLVHGVFEANGVGIDEFMDLVGFEVDSDGDIIIRDRGTGGPLGEIPESGEVVTPTPAELEAFITSRAVLQQARNVAEAIEDLFPSGQGYPSAVATQNALGSYVSTTFLESGQDFTGLKALWDEENPTGPRPGVEVLSIGLIRPMDLATLHSDLPANLRGSEVPAGYDKGTWVSMRIRNGARVTEQLFGFVRQNANSGNAAASWKWNGNGIPFEFGGRVFAEAVKSIGRSTPSTPTYTSGFTSYFENGTATAISSKGIAAVYVINDIFPTYTNPVGETVNCIRLIPNGSDAAAPWEIATTGTAAVPSADVSAGNRYIKAITEAQARQFSPEIFFVAVDSSDEEVLGWPGFMPLIPEIASFVQDNQQKLFAALNALGATAIANADSDTLIGNDQATLSIDWTNPTHELLVPKEATALLTNGNTTTAVINGNTNPLTTVTAWHATAFDLSGITTDNDTGLAIRIRSVMPHGMVYTTLHEIP